jgi:hypothetical protein
MKKPISFIISISVTHRTRQYDYGNGIIDFHKDSLMEVIDGDSGIYRFDFHANQSEPLNYPQNAVECVLRCYKRRLKDIDTIPDANMAERLKLAYMQRVAYLENLLKVNLAVVDYSEGHTIFDPEIILD